MKGRFSGAQRLILTEVYCHEYQPGEGATYVRIDNPGAAAIDLSDWTLEWDGTALRFPAGSRVAPGGAVYAAWQDGAFQRGMTRLPDFAVQPSPHTARLVASAAPPAGLAPERGTVRLLSPAGEAVDAFAWGDAPAPPGWIGPGAATVDAGVVYQRAIDEATLNPISPGSFVAAGGNAAAWRQGTDWLPRRRVRLGQGRFTYPTWTADSTLVFAAPDGTRTALQNFLNSAREQLDINLYLFTHAEVAALVAAALQRQVRVRILVELEPFNAMSEGERNILARLQADGAQIRGLCAAAGGFKRYHFDHAKYAIADGQRSLVMTFNWTGAVMPDAGVMGERGWGAIVDSVPLADYLTQVFNFDWNPASPDSVPFDPTAVPTAPPLPPGQHPPIARPSAAPTLPLAVSEPVQVTPFLAPEHALLESHGITGILRSARQTLDIQQDTVELYWEYGDQGSPATTPNLYLDEIVAAARRGVHVRLLLAGGYHDPQNPRDNAYTQRYLLDLASRENLPLECRLLTPAGAGIGMHNLGLIADGQQVMISSINWTENSSLNNREMALVLASADVARYFGQLFQQDWQSGSP